MLVVISYEIFETHQRLVSLTSYEMTTSVRSAISINHEANKAIINEETDSGDS